MFERLGVAAPQSEARKLVDEFGSLRGVLAARSRRQARVLHDVDASDGLALLRSIVKRVLEPETARPLLQQLARVSAQLAHEMAELDVEKVRVLYVDARGRLIRDEIASTGTVDQSILPIREIIARAIELGAHGLILAHNHPSGDPTPSTADVRMTRKIAQAASYFDIVVHDHLIVSRTGTRSMRAGAR